MLFYNEFLRLSEFSGINLQNIETFSQISNGNFSI